MSLIVTTLNGAILASAQQVKLTAFTSQAGNNFDKQVLVIDGEAMLITDTSLSPTLSVVRGFTDPNTGKGTIAGPHNTLAPAVYGKTQDFTSSTGGLSTLPVVSYGADGAITVPVVDQTIYITKGSAAALTLAGPNNDSTVTVKVISLSAFAHTITYTAGFYQNTTSSDVATFPATSGATFVFQAKNGVWNAVGNVSSAGVTLG